MTTLTLGTARPPEPTVEGYDAVRSDTEQLAAPLSPEDQTVQSMPDVSPTKWHRAHTTWFFETFVLEPHVAGYVAHDPSYRYLFNSYYEAVGPRHARPERGLVSRPGVAEVGVYRHVVDDAMRALLDAGDVAPDVAALVELGLHHEQQHQELLLMDIKHVLSCNPLQPAYDAACDARPPAPNPPLGWVGHGGGLVRIGRDAYGGGGFAFDNESPAHDVHLRPFALADRPVTCGDWQAFVDDGGYRRSDLWLSDGWAAVNALGWDAPLYWSREGDGGATVVFTLAGPQPIDPSAAVCHISYYEADAYARWAGARLPTEAEWETLAPHKVGRTHEVWEWTASAYLPYPGFHPAAGAVGEYNGKFMVGQHVLRGGGAITPRGHVRPTYRNFFPPGARWPFAGLRLARDL